MIRLSMVTFVACILGAVACSGGDDGSGGSTGPASSSSVIPAAEGGEVKASGATLDIPAGSLGADVTVTVDAVEPSGELPELDSVQGLVYDFGPDGTTFDPPATLELPLPGSVPEGQEAVVSWLDESKNAWVDLVTEVSGNAVSAPVSHFTMFVVRFRDVDAGAVSCDFAACGGDPVGTWKIIGACIDSGSPTDNPYESCGGTFDVVIDGSGSVEFGSDGVFSASIEIAPTMKVVLPASCLEAYPTKPGSCAELSEIFGDGGAVCTGDVASACECEGLAGEPNSSDASGTYTVDGNGISIMKSGDTTVEPSEFCVEGSKMKLSSGDTLLVLQRQ